MSGIFSGVIGEFSLKELDGFPYIFYQENKDRYDDYEYWYSGRALDTTKKVKGDESEYFPARANPLRTAAEKHVSALFGEFTDGGDTPPVRFRVKPKNDAERKRADYVEGVLAQVFSENNAGPAMIENGLLSQVYGGCVFRLAWDPEDASLSTGLRLDPIHPKYFIGVPDGTNFWKLKEAWIVQQITAEEALRYGVEIPNLYAWYIEYWSPERYEVRINNVLLGYTLQGELYAAGGENPFGFVPFVYIPHTRNGSFYGQPILNDAIKGLLKEFNKNIADAGDAAKAEAAGYGIMSGVRGVPQVIELADGLAVINLGMGAPNLSGGESKPSLESMRIGALSAPMVDLVEKTEKLLNRELFTPDVAYGEFGGGSQRSSSSLYTMMWHLTAHVKLERVWWTAGLRVLAKMVLAMLAKQGEMGITESDLKLQINTQWAGHLPRDRSELIDELAVRSANQLGSKRHLLELSGDVENAPEMVEEIIDELEKLAKIEASKMPDPASDARKTGPSSRIPKKDGK
jgi:hypothetical protein